MIFDTQKELHCSPKNIDKRPVWAKMIYEGRVGFEAFNPKTIYSKHYL